MMKVFSRMIRQYNVHNFLSYYIYLPASSIMLDTKFFREQYKTRRPFIKKGFRKQAFENLLSFTHPGDIANAKLVPKRFVRPGVRLGRMPTLESLLYLLARNSFSLYMWCTPLMLRECRETLNRVIFVVL